MLTAELEKTKADNVKLYGKIRYVQDYNLEKVVSRGSKKVSYCNSVSFYIMVAISSFLISIFLTMFSIQKTLKVVSAQMLNPSTRRYMKMI